MGEFETSNYEKHHVAPLFFLLIKSSFCLFSFSRNRVTGVYEVSLCNLADAGSPGESLHKVIILH